MEPLVRWLLTYLVHSTLLLGAAGLARLALRERRLAFQEAVLRAALVGGFVTASLQIGLELRPLGGSLAVPESAPPSPCPRRAGPPAPDRSPHLPPGRGARSSTSSGPAGAERRRRRCRRALEDRARARVGCPRGCGLARLAVAARRLRRLLRDRRPIDAGELAPEAARLARRSACAAPSA